MADVYDESRDYFNTLMYSIKKIRTRFTYSVPNIQYCFCKTIKTKRTNFNEHV